MLLAVAETAGKSPNFVRFYRCVGTLPQVVYISQDTDLAITFHSLKICRAKFCVYFCENGCPHQVESCSLFVPMQEQLYTLVPLHPRHGTIAPGLTLLEAFTRLMAIAERDFMFFRTGAWVMHLTTPSKPAGEPQFESTLAVDAQARAEIMGQVCDHGLGLFQMIPHKQSKTEGLAHERAA